MPGQPIVTAQGAGILAAGVRPQFWDVYLRDYTASQERLAAIMSTEPSDKDQETYAYLLAAPHARIWRRGEAISEKAMRDLSWTVVNRDWGRRISFHKNDRINDQTRSILTMARDVGASMALLDERVVFQIMTAATDIDLLPAVPTAADGAALYSTTGIGSTARYGITNGNLLTASGVASGAAIQYDFLAAVGQMTSFQDGEGQPYHASNVFDAGFLVIFNATSNLKVFYEAFEQAMTAQAVTTSTSNAGVTNIIKGRYAVDLWGVSSARISDNDWFIFAKGGRHKPFIKQVRQETQEQAATMENSDSVRTTQMEYLQYDNKAGYGVNTPIATVKQNN